MKYIVVLSETGETINTTQIRGTEIDSIPKIFNNLKEAKDQILILPISYNNYLIIPLIDTIPVIVKMLKLIRAFVKWLPNCQLADDAKIVIEDIEKIIAL